jgi:endonuclease/exonuclease/phosphatase family metal-dependent hydrolase
MVDIIRRYGRGRGRAFELVEVHERLYSSRQRAVVADGRDDWEGWLNLIPDDLDWRAVENLARVIDAVRPDVLVAVEVEDRLTMQRFNDDVLANFGWSFPYALLVDGNDGRGIDVGLFSGHPIRSVRSHVWDTDSEGTIFSRDCAEFEVELPAGPPLWVLANHLKSKGYGSQARSNKKRTRQAKRVRAIYREALQRSPRVAIAGDFNDYPASAPIRALTSGLGAREVMTHGSYAGKPGTYKTGSSPKQKIDYICLSPALWGTATAVEQERRGIYAPRTHQAFPEVTSRVTQASDHALLWVDLNL